MQIKCRAEQDKALQQNPPNYLTDLPARRKMHRQLCSRLSARGPNTSRRCSEPLCEASGRKKPHSPSASPLSLTWASFGGGLVKPWLFPTCLCMCLSILSAPPAEPARWMQFLWLLQLPGPGRAVGCWSWQDRRLPLDQPET